MKKNNERIDPIALANKKILDSGCELLESHEARIKDKIVRRIQDNVSKIQIHGEITVLVAHPESSYLRQHSEALERIKKEVFVCCSSNGISPETKVYLHIQELNTTIPAQIERIMLS